MSNKTKQFYIFLFLTNFTPLSLHYVHQVDHHQNLTVLLHLHLYLLQICVKCMKNRWHELQKTFDIFKLFVT
jgi:hypothetical protein